MDKASFRKSMIDLRGSIPENIRAEKSREITLKITGSDAYKHCRTLLSFISMGSEPDTALLIKTAIKDGKKVACPNALPKTRIMLFFEINSLEGFAKSKYGALEPPYDEGRLVVPDDGALIIIPGLAFDREGYRIGYGGGYYDTYIENNPAGYRLGIAFNEMIVDCVPRLPHDRRIDCLMTDREDFVWKSYPYA